MNNVVNLLSTVCMYVGTYVYTFVCCVQYVCSNMLLSTYGTYVHSFIETQKQLYLQIEHFGTKSLYDLRTSMCEDIERV